MLHTYLIRLPKRLADGKLNRAQQVRFDDSYHVPLA